MKPLVSVVCYAFNHEKYIRDALDGFIKQKTTFPYEIIVHDDASTDKTADIIKEYAQKYPGLIVPILQNENQYSKGVWIFKEFIYPSLQGKYHALCEGDDYWCDENKLQRQVDWMEEHTEYAFCGHNTKIVNCLTGDEDLYCANTEDCDVTMEDILRKGGLYFHTSSFLFRAEYSLIPDGFRNKMFGDYPRTLYLHTCGKVHYFHDVMSVYRWFANGSWSMKTYKSSEAIKRELLLRQEMIKTLSYADEYTNGQYTELINNRINYCDFRILLLNNEIKKAKEKYPNLFYQMKVFDRIKLDIKWRWPTIYKYIQDAVRK